MGKQVTTFASLVQALGFPLHCLANVVQGYHIPSLVLNDPSLSEIELLSDRDTSRQTAVHNF